LDRDPIHEEKNLPAAKGNESANSDIGPESPAILILIMNPRDTLQEIADVLRLRPIDFFLSDDVNGSRKIRGRDRIGGRFHFYLFEDKRLFLASVRVLLGNGDYGLNNAYG